MAEGGGAGAAHGVDMSRLGALVTHEFSRRVRLPVSAAEAFAWHMRPGAFERLNAPWAPVRVVNGGDGVRDGARVTVVVPGPPPIRWTLEHHDVHVGRSFADRQIAGPFGSWSHEHRFESDGEASVLEDRISYAMPFGRLGDLARAPIESTLARLFTWRHRVTAADLAFRSQLVLAPRRILLAGASGLIGRALTTFLTTQGHAVIRLVRHPARASDERSWDPASGVLDPSAFDGVDAVVNLAGESVAHGRWSDARRRALLDSRVQTTGLLARTMAARAQRPAVLISASAVGAYGDRGDESLDESCPLGDGVLAGIARAWEAAAQPAREVGIRVVHPRFGLVLTPLGGALEPLLRATRWGLAGPLGSGRQWWSWISLDDVLRVLTFAIARADLSGPVNLTSPSPVRQRDLASALGRVLGRPAWTPAPAVALRTLLGDMADEMLLASQRAMPAALERAGYPFLDSDLDAALRAMLGRA